MLNVVEPILNETNLRGTLKALVRVTSAMWSIVILLAEHSTHRFRFNVDATKHVVLQAAKRQPNEGDESWTTIWQSTGTLP